MRMIDVGGKPPTSREAVARAVVRMKPETLARLIAGDLPKGDPLPAARIAAVMAAKRTAELIPLCHPIPITFAGAEFSLDREQGELTLETTVRTLAPTGAEMEALTGAAIGALTIYDMCKAVEPGMEVVSLHLVRKSGGKSGEWRKG